MYYYLFLGHKKKKKSPSGKKYIRSIETLGNSGYMPVHNLMGTFSMRKYNKKPCMNRRSAIFHNSEQKIILKHSVVGSSTLRYE